MTDLLDEAIAVWRECPCQLPDFAQTSPAPTYGPEQQALHEREFDLFLQSVGAELSTVPGDRAARVAAQGRISSAFVRLASAGLDLTGAHLRLLLDGGFSAIGTQLGRQARRMQVPASVADIFQASRNAWTACGLQLLVGEEMRLSPSIFAYSMLYPATDNYLDASDISREEKIGFSLRFGRRLGGAEVSPANAHEREIWRLVAMIEEEHPRALRAPVYEGLLGIHQAQQESLRFQSRGSGGSEAELLSVSFNKGGASVVADALLASATLPPAVKRFAYFWGVFLQLADDLQDLREDLGGGALTLFTGAAGREPLDALTAKTLHFGSRVMRQMDGLPHGPVRSVDPGRGTDGADDGSDALKDLIRTSSRTVVVRSAGELAEFYSPEYLAGLECYSPCRFAFLRERRKQMAARRAATGRLFEAFLSGDDDEPAFPLLPSSLLPR